MTDDFWVSHTADGKSWGLTRRSLTYEVKHNVRDGSLVYRNVVHDDDNATTDWSYVSMPAHREVVRHFGLVALPRQEVRDRG